jgi:hypothetical protein
MSPFVARKPPAAKGGTAKPGTARPARPAQGGMGPGARGYELLPGVAAPGRRLTKWHFLGIGLLAFGLGYLVCRVADWLVTSDEERIVALLESLAARARDGRLPSMLEDVKLADYGFSAGGWGETYSFGAGEEEKLLAQAGEWSRWPSVRSVRIKLDEDDVKVEGDRARASANLLFEEGGRPWRQPVRFLFRKGGDRWYVTGLELVSPDELLRP